MVARAEMLRKMYYTTIPGTKRVKLDFAVAKGSRNGENALMFTSHKK